ncbi:MAG: hypothetical protein JW751_13955 [Polyangiaceae bacterium]|nr:hypothetical protein [Polyangiaceae bacterium]
MTHLGHESAPRVASPRLRTVSLLAVGLGIGACRSPTPVGDGAAPSASTPTSVPVDRLAPGELAPSETTLFGLALPRGMVVDGVFGDVAYASGKLRREEVSNYIRTRVAVAHVELGVARTVFPAVRIPGQPAHHVYRIEVFSQGVETRLSVRRFTPRPEEPGLSEAERWRRAGYHPDGTPLNPKGLK